MHKSGGKEVFVGGGRSRTPVVFMEARWSDGEVGSGGGYPCRQIDLISVRGETCLYEIVSPPKPRGHCNMLVAVAEVKKESWAQNDEGSKVKIDYK